MPPSANICGLKSIAQLNNNQPQTSTNNSLNNNSSGGQGWVGSLSKEDERFVIEKRIKKYNLNIFLFLAHLLLRQ